VTADRAAAPVARSGPAPAGRSPTTVVLRRTARRTTRSGALWGYVFGAVVVSSAWSYSGIYRSPAQRAALAAAFGSNRTTIALFGPAPNLGTVAGFTVLKTFLTLTVIGAVWGLLTATRLLRGEEQDGRWELLLAGATTRGRATAQAAGGLLAGIAALWAVTSVILEVAGHSSRVDIGAGAGLFFALALVAGALMFTAVGALTSQLAATRRQAAGYAGVFLGVSYALRLVADSGTGLHWLVWCTPLGWVEELQPLTSPRWLPLVPVVAFTVVVGAVTVRLAGARDIGSSILPDRDRAEPHLRLLSGQLGLTVRLVRPTLVAWAAALVASGLLFGLVAEGAGATLSGSSVRDVFARLGASGGGASAYLGVTFLVVAVLLAFVGAAQVTAARSEESAGRLDPLLTRPVTRTRWLAGRLLVAVLALAACAVLAGLSTFVGALAGGAHVGAGAVVGAGLNTLAPAVCVLGLGALAYGVAPRTTAPVVYGVVTWSVLVDVIGGIGGLDHWVADTSVFHQMAAAPSVSPNWQATGWLATLGVVSAVAGCAALARRDVQDA
jgi:ABC-2 type transport system permease protein